MKDYSYVFNAHPEFVDALYQQFIKDPNSIEQGWRIFFDGFEFAGRSGGAQVVSPNNPKESSVAGIIHGYRTRGHLLSETNPIRKRKDRQPNLSLSDYNLTEADLNEQFAAGIEIGMPNATLAQIIQRLEQIYCGHIGFEFKHITDRIKRRWLRDKIEKRTLDSYHFSIEKKKRILSKLNGAVGFEAFLHKKYIGQKRFSIEGAETTIPALDAIINLAAESGVEEVVMGMAHRGRLNVLVNIMGKTYDNVFNEFEGTVVPDEIYGSGDVKYHLGFSSQVEAANGKTIHLKLAPNPSHLEAVDPVVLGFSRAKADMLYGSDYDKILPILIHGDAAVAGQGIIYEIAQMSQLKGYYVGGTIHFVINNQIGFTTDFDDARTSTYSTGVAQLIQAPVFHVNGDDPEAVVFAVELATEYRQEFNSDVFIDMVCYRRHGHNEGDDPQFTQPEMYKLIANHANPRELYVAQLNASGALDKEVAEEMEKSFWNELQQRLDLVKQNALPYQYQEPEISWRSLSKEIKDQYFQTSPNTGIKPEVFNVLVDHLLKTPPNGFNILPKAAKLLKSKMDLVSKDKFDWAMGELMAYGSILLSGKNVRMSGQDIKRGTFSHRHAVFFDTETNEEYNRLDGMNGHQGQFMIYNSLLSEYGVLGFEYGYALSSPDHLVIWEAQFGDFFNGAQTIVDQFITTGRSKWQRMNGMVLLLPHGYEGQGPEHSSARLERWLQNCSENNICVVNITSPANYFHVIRRQLEWNFRIPLVVMSPKSLLRHPLCVSSKHDFMSSTKFMEVIPEINLTDQVRVKKVVMCSGKVYYDLLEYRNQKDIKNIAIVRLEQLYPFPEVQLKSVLSAYKNAELVWVQEEPINMGAASHVKLNIGSILKGIVARSASASPATGFKKVHDQEQLEILVEAFA